jgi:polar amino acid transport system permease protein
VNWSWPYFFEYLTNGLMLRGAWTTVWLSVVSMILGLGLGVVAAMMKMYGNAVCATSPSSTSGCSAARRS